jgi:hypothetical protein
MKKNGSGCVRMSDLDISWVVGVSAALKLVT